jgi:O-antigen/teichoic acid export membrane protein
MSCLIDAGLLIKKKTQFKPIIFGLTAAVAILAHSILTPKYTIVGAASATCISFGFLYLINKHYSDRFYKVTLNSGDFLSIVTAAGIAYLSFALMFEPDAPVRRLFTSALVPALVYPAVLMIMRPKVTKQCVDYILKRQRPAPKKPT